MQADDFASPTRFTGPDALDRTHQFSLGALFDLRHTHRDGTVLVVSHGDVIRAALLFALGMPLDFYSRIEVSLASINTVHIDNSGIRVITVNERPRLAP